MVALFKGLVPRASCLASSRLFMVTHLHHFQGDTPNSA
jgi:hypothetical protein